MTAEAPIVDAEIVPEPAVPETRQASTELVRRERRSEVLRPLDAAELVGSFKAYQDLLPQLLEASDYQAAGRDADGKPRRFVKKSGWRKIATAFDLDVILVSDEVERDDAGRAIRAKVIARAIAPSGRTMDGDGYCAITEKRFNKSGADLSKVENDLRATATTRAKNRAIADLVGMGDVSAEEIGDDLPPAQAGPPFGPEYDKAIGKEAGAACVALCDGNTTRGVALWKRIMADLGGYMPQAAAVALINSADPPPLEDSVETPEL